MVDISLKILFCGTIISENALWTLHQQTDPELPNTDIQGKQLLQKADGPSCQKPTSLHSIIMNPVFTRQNGTLDKLISHNTGLNFWCSCCMVHKKELANQ